MKTATIILAALALSACAGRSPAPVAVVQPADRSLDCTQVAAEVQANNQKISALASEGNGKIVQNTLAIGVGLLFWPVLFAVDFQGTSSKETAALQQRQSYLASLAVEKKCGA